MGELFPALAFELSSSAPHPDEGRDFVGSIREGQLELREVKPPPAPQELIEEAKGLVEQLERGWVWFDRSREFADMIATLALVYACTAGEQPAQVAALITVKIMELTEQAQRDPRSPRHEVSHRTLCAFNAALRRSA
jgi:hypothetical protein